MGSHFPDVPWGGFRVASFVISSALVSAGSDPQGSGVTVATATTTPRTWLGTAQTLYINSLKPVNSLCHLERSIPPFVPTPPMDLLVKHN